MLSPKGAQGHFQFMPATAKQYGLTDPGDLNQSATAAARMFSDLMKQTGGDVSKALAGYNWGIGNVQSKGMDSAPAETRNYIQKVTANMAQPDDPWAALRSQFTQGAPAKQEEGDPWAQLAAQFAQKPVEATTEPSPAIPTPTPAAASQPTLTGFDRLAQGMRDPIDGGAQLLTKMLPDSVVRAGDRLNNWLADNTGLVSRLPEGGVDQQVRDREAQYQAQRGKDAGVDWMRIGGNVLSPANIAIGARLPAAATLGGKVLAGAAGGGLSAALNPVTQEGDFAGNKLSQIGIGGATGGLMPVLTAGLGRVISPNASRNPDVRMLRDAGVQPTIGQTLGGRWNAAEEKLVSVPIMGDTIANARNSAREGFNQAAINRTLAPIGQKTDLTGQEGVRQAGDMIGAAYDQARNRLGNVRLDRQAIGELRNLTQMTQKLPPTEANTFQRIWNTVATDVSPNGTITADVFKRIDSKLGKDAARFAGSPDAYQKQLGDALSELRRIVSDNALRANPGAAQATRAADAAYANLVRLEGASKAAAGTQGLFTPGQLLSAVRQADRSVRDRSTARGTALMQDLATAGQKVLGNKVPNSATADRLLLGAGGLGAGLLNPAIPIGLLGGAGLYTSPLQRLLTGAVAARPQGAQAISNALMDAAPRLGPAAAQVSLGLLN